VLRSTNSSQSARPFSSLALQPLCHLPPLTLQPLRLSAPKSLTALSSGRATERPLGNKSAKRNKGARESLEGNEVATSVREFSEQLKDSDASYARRAEEKLKLAKQSHQLKMYQTVFVHESSTASQGEKALAEKKLRSQFFSSLGDEEGGATGEYDNAGGVVRGVGSTPSAIQPTAPPALHEGYNNAPHVHGSTEMADKSQDSSH
jgi:flagellar basal body rod protein FlgC